MKKFFKFLLIAFVWLLIAAVLVFGAMLLDQPLQGAFILLAVLFGGWLLFLLLRRLIVRYRAKKRAEALVHVEEADTSGESRFSRYLQLLGWGTRGALERRFRQLVQLLQGSRLREQGDPLYVLPWYLLLGQQGSGKTSLLRGADLAGPTIDDEALRGDGDSLGWWLYDEAIVIDAPGTYIGVDENAARHPEWPTLLKLLSRDREREPLNGIVVTISQERLQRDTDSLFDEGRLLRKRIDELMRAVKLQLPVYVVVTQSDRLTGFNAWCDALSREAREQPMGLANAERAAAADFVQQALSSVADRIKNLMLVLVNDGKVDAQLLCLPLAIESLRPGLTAFADGLFRANSFEESPRFQGLYFTGRHGERQAFARQLFSTVLPRNRRVISTLSSAERAERTVRRVLMSGWGMAIVVLAALLIGAWSTHKGYLQETGQQVAGKLGRAESLPENIEVMHAMRLMIREVDGEVRGWWMPWFGLPGLARPPFLHDLRLVYEDRVYRDVLSPLDERFQRALDEAIAAIGKGELSESRLAYLIGALVGRINLLAAYADGVRDDALFSYPGPFDDSAVYFSEPVDPLTVERLNNLYKQALIWSNDPEKARRELSLRREQLVKLLEASDNRMSWLIPWANDYVGGKGVTLGDFWEGSGHLDSDIRVEPAFTVAGFEAIQDFLEQLWWAGLDQERFLELERAFQTHYRQRYLAAWERFAQQFGRGAESLRGRSEWLATVNAMATPRNPHFQLLSTLYVQLAPFADEELPEWAAMVRYYDSMRSFAPDDGQDDTARNRVLSKLALRLLKSAGPVGKQLAKAGKQGMKTQRQLAGGSSGVSPDEAQMRLEEAGGLLGEYREALSEIAYNSDIRSASHAGARSLFANPDNPGKGDGPEARAHETIRRLQSLVGPSTQYNRVFWNVFSGPLDVIERYFIQESACYVQELWERNFLVKLEGVPQHRLPALMFGDNGELWQFLERDLGPFVSRRFQSGYVPTSVRGQRLPLRSELLEFATRGRAAMQSREDSYAVQIEALPTSTNNGAVHRPSRSALQLRCSSGDQSLVNYNFPVDTVFNWSEQCADTVLEIDVGRYTLEKTYSGPNGFPQFLQDFRMGSKRFRPEHFPNHERILMDYGIEHIDIEFRLRGHERVIAFLQNMPLNPPHRIAECWN